MALFVNARTYEVLYIIRQLARADKDATVTAISGFIAERRHAAPDTYANAYISPGNLTESLQRLVQEGVLTLGPAFAMTPKGSQMADVLDDVDACTTTFLEGYKGIIVEAALKQRVRLNLPPASQQDLAQATGLSVDSVRRGLSELEGTVITTAMGRTQTYTLANPPAVPVPSSTLPAADILGDFDDSPLVPDSAPDPVAEPDADETVDIARLLEGVDEAPAAPTPDPTPATPTPDPTPAAPTPDGPFDWNAVPVDLREAFVQKAKATRMTLTQFLAHLDETLTAQLRATLFGDWINE